MIMPKRLDRKLAVVLLIIALSCTLATTLTSVYTARKLFPNYLARTGSMQAQNYADYFASYYQQYNSFSGIDKQVFSGGRGNGYGRMGQGGGPGSRIMLVKPDGLILWDSMGVASGQTLPGEQINKGIPVQTGGQTVAYVVSGRQEAMNIGALEGDFINSLTSYALLIGLLVGAFALWLGVILARPIIKPIEILSQATHKLARGELDTRVAIDGDAELQKLSQDFNAMAESLKNSQTMRRNLTADIAHELRTPLTILRSSLENMQSGTRDTTPENIAPIIDEVIRMGRLVKDMELLALAETGNLVLHKSGYGMDSLLERLSPAFDEVEGLGISLELRINEQLPPLNMDLDRILQVMLNLLSNAIAHSPANSRILLNITEEQNGIKIAISDQGEGIPPEQLPFVFDRFYRADSARSRRDGGMGLGLAIAKSLVEAHGGSIWAESKPGQGSTFIFTIPGQAKS